jgi:hypothetical protein
MDVNRSEIIEAREARRQTAARQEFAELALDEPRQALAVAPRGRLRTERLEMIANEAMKLTGPTIARGRRGAGKGRRARRGRAANAAGRRLR